MGESVDGVPTSHAEAMRSEHAREWKAAEDEEYGNCARMNTYEAVDKPPVGATVLRSLIVYVEKKDQNGKVIKRKARVVACGYGQQYLRDFIKTKADVAPTRSFRLVAGIAVKEDEEAIQIDVKAAFLNSELKEEIYIVTPDGCKQRYWKLKKALYGLKQAAHLWRETVDKRMKEIGLAPTEADPAVYYKRTTEGLVALAVHVDDMLVVTPGKRHSDWLVTKLKQKWDIKVEENPQWLLHMTITRDKETGSLKLDQSQYLKDALDKFDPNGTHTSRVPIPRNTYIAPLGKDEKSDLTEDEIHTYQAIVGSINYVAVHTRPDLSYIAGALVRSLHNPGKKHLEAAYRMLSYVRKTLDCGVVYKKGGNKSGLIGYSDANFAGDQDRHSIGGYMFMLDGCPISWASRRQKTVSVSTEEAELNAASEATREGIALKSLCSELGVIGEKDDVVIKIDNKPAYDALINPGYYGRLKHVDICHKFVM